MTTAVRRQNALASAALALVVLWVGTANGRQAKGLGAGKAPAAAASQVKAIKLAHADPEEVRQTVTSMWVPLMAAHGIRVAGPVGGPGPGLHLAANARTRTLFARGSEKELEVVEDLIKVLDTAPGESLPEGKGLPVIRLRHTKVPEVIQVLGGLGLQAQVIALPKMNALILPRAESEAKEVRAVIEKLDVEEKADGKTDKKLPPAGK